MIPKNTEIRMELINRCNYSCQLCMEKKLTRPRCYMSTEMFKSLLDKILAEADHYKNVSFAGIGEPLLDFDIIEKIKYVKSKGLNPILVTNALLLTLDKFRELQDAGLYSVRVSFHGANAQDYSRLHGVPQQNFYQIKDTIAKIAKEKNTTRLLLTCAFVQGVNNRPVEEWLGLWEGLNVDLLEVWKAHNWVDSLNNRVVQEKKVNTCGRIENGPLQVQADGLINACCFDWDGKLIFGDLKTQSLTEIFSSPEYNNIKEKHRTGNFNNSGLICEFCDQRNSCKKDVLLYSSKYDLNERVRMTSTTYEKVI